jgi:copper chaperone
LQTKQVKIDSAEDRQDFAEALTDAGYPPAQ